MIRSLLCQTVGRLFRKGNLCNMKSLQYILLLQA